MELELLRAFVAFCEHLNFTRAAEELGVAQPAVTRHINNLEDWLGAPLFERSGNAVRLNAAGRQASDLLSATFDRMEVGLAALRSDARRDIVIAGSFGIVHLWLMPRITAMRDAAGGASINFLTSETYSDFDHADLDFSIRFGAASSMGDEADLLFREETHLIASPAFVEAHPELHGPDPAAHLEPDWLIEHGDPNSYGWMTLARWLDRNHPRQQLKPTRPAVASYPAALDMVRCGEGVALGFAGLDERYVETGEIVRLGKQDIRADYGYFLVSESDFGVASAKAELREHLISYRADPGV